MSYQVLARKWRPRVFQDVVGQEHVLRALANALDRNQVHHAFLFTGTRGVGKTTIARILAKAVNCEQGVSATPCGECASCREIDEGRFVDLIEVDAASRTKVEDTRELLENVQYAPTRGRFKVYLIDEVHMLSGHSFNALLKTLEEPPPHVKFLLATTDPQKLPVTILSRCLQFNLKRLSPERIRDHLAHILDSEQVAYQAPALACLARGAEGSVRDALSLLDQAIAYGGGTVEEADVRAMLGTIEQDEVRALVEALAGGDAAALLAGVQRLVERSADFDGVLNDLLTLLHRIALAQVVPEGIDDSLGDRETVSRLAGALSPEDVQLYYQIGLLGRRDMALGPDPHLAFEMLMLRMLAFRPAPDPSLTEGASAEAPPKGASRGAVGAAPAPPPRRAAAGTPDVAAAPQAPVPPSGPPGGGAGGADAWAAIVGELGLTGVALQLALHCALTHVSTGRDRVELLLSSAHKHLHNKDREQRIERALQAHYGTALKLALTVGEGSVDTPASVEKQRQAVKAQSAREAVDQDANIKTLKETFNARIVPDSIQPND
ncbi:MAG TPA: DNA polymerase III subunit gamma/tau [Gammaproteobacteria bacterium]|nr:DNA polymerase III subunit gamma/tau [Gammaproteobacteria bacterium]